MKNLLPFCSFVKNIRTRKPKINFKKQFFKDKLSSGNRTNKH